MSSPTLSGSGIRDTILEAIGWTPMVRLHRVPPANRPEFLVKVEAANPGGSTKDRVGDAMIRQAEASGALRPGGTIIEATAGNTGIGLAIAAAVRGYRCIFVLPDKMSADKTSLLRAYGAEVVITPTDVPPDSPESYNGVAARAENTRTADGPALQECGKSRFDAGGPPPRGAGLLPGLGRPCGARNRQAANVGDGRNGEL